jgi:hypothetical protein
MPALTILLAILKFAAFEAAFFLAAIRLARAFGVDRWLAILAIEITLEASAAQVLSFAHLNSQASYSALAIVLAIFGRWPDLKRPAANRTAAAMAALAAPLALLAFRPVDEIDSINYLHYLLDWMGNRATPYSFATYYVAFWELSFLPVWMVTGVDLFFPILALKGVALLALAAWAVGRELNVRPMVLAWTVFGAITMRHYWLEHSGIATLKNDAAHGAGFLLLMLMVLRASRRRLEPTDVALFGLGLAFATVKYSGIFTALIAAAAIVWLTRDRRLVWSGTILLLTSGHYYVRSLLRFGNPFYPFQINLGPLHLPGEADLSYTSILYNLRDPRLWKLLFIPAGGVSPAGLLFPAILAGTLAGCLWKLGSSASRRQVNWAALFIFCGWLLYFRSVYSASAGHGDLAFLANSLNSLRYVDGLLAASEVWLAGLLGPWALPLVAIDTASRLALLYARIPFPALAVGALSIAVGAAVYLSRRWAAAVVAAALVICGPLIVQRNRVRWTTYWDDLKPAVAAVRGPDLAVFALEDTCFFAGHVVAAGNPVDSRVRAVHAEELDALPPAARPRYLAVFVTPGSDWRSKYGEKLANWAYKTRFEAPNGAVLVQNFR